MSDTNNRFSEIFKRKLKSDYSGEFFGKCHVFLDELIQEAYNGWGAKL